MYGIPVYGLTKKNRRRHRRDPLSASITALWGSSGEHEELTQAKLIDISPQGGRFRVGVRMPAGAWFMFNHQKEGIHGRGTVRYCRLVKGMFEVGVDFPNGSGWRTKEQVAPEPTIAESTIEMCPNMTLC